MKLAISFLLDNGVIILAIRHFDKLLESQWVLIQPLFTFHDKQISILLWEEMAFKHQKRDLQKSCPFHNIFCFLDDLWAMDNLLKFDKNCKDTYSSELELKKESIATSKASYQITLHKHSRFWGSAKSKKSFW